MSQALVTWYGHSCFRIELAGSSIVLDPYAPASVPGIRLPDLRADAVHCSHGHSDHNASDRVELSGKPVNFVLRTLEGTHDHHAGTRRGKNRIAVLEGDGLRIVHLGDQGCLLTQAQIDAIGRPDLLLVPVGGFFTIDCAEARAIVEQLRPRVAVPMHFREGKIGYDKISTVDAFLEGDRPVVRIEGDSFAVTPDMPEQIILPKLVQ